jgi:hypothetical protein
MVVVRLWRILLWAGEGSMGVCEVPLRCTGLGAEDSDDSEDDGYVI